MGVRTSNGVTSQHGVVGCEVEKAPGASWDGAMTMQVGDITWRAMRSSGVGADVDSNGRCPKTALSGVHRPGLWRLAMAPG